MHAKEDGAAARHAAKIGSDTPINRPSTLTPADGDATEPRADRTTLQRQIRRWVDASARREAWLREQYRANLGTLPYVEVADPLELERLRPAEHAAVAIELAVAFYERGRGRRIIPAAPAMTREQFHSSASAREAFAMDAARWARREWVPLVPVEVAEGLFVEVRRRWEEHEAAQREHPAIRLFRALNGLHQVCFNVGAFRDLNEQRKSKWQAWIDSRNALAQIDVKAAMERADEPVPMNQPAASTRVLHELLSSGLRLCSQANDALVAKGGETLDSALAPGTSVHATEIGMRVNEAEDLFVRLDSALRDPRVSIMDASIQGMETLRDWFASARDRLRVVMEQRGLVMAAPHVTSQRESRAEQTPTTKSPKAKRSQRPKPRARRGALRSKPARKSVPKAVQQELDELDNRTPPLTKGDGKWVSSKVAAGMEGVEVGTLAKYRNLGLKNDALTLGRDRDGRVWRKVGGKSARPWYLKSSLQGSDKKSLSQP